jgi:phenylalanyl-tRNA synthetase beta chain
MVFQAPPHRLDVARECDLIEEIIRFHGYDRLGERSYNAGGLSASEPPLDRMVREIRRAWVHLGFSEMLTRALADPKDFVRSGWTLSEVESMGVHIPEPQSEEESCLRLSLVPGALKSVALNMHRGTQELRLFEVGPIFLRHPSETTAREPVEVIAVCSAGDFGPDLTRVDPRMDHARFRGLVEAFLVLLRVDTPRVRCYDENGFEEGTSLIIESQGKRVGIFGQIASKICESWDIPRPVLAARFSVSDLFDAAVREITYRESSRFPASKRDLAFLVDEDVAEATVEDLIRKLGGELLRGVALFDRFCGPPLPEGKISLGFTLTWQADDRTLSVDEVRSSESRVVSGLERELKAQLRDK